MIALHFFQVVVFFPNDALLGDAWLIEGTNFTSAGMYVMLTELLLV
jgi:hypothetical protein